MRHWSAICLLCLLIGLIATTEQALACVISRGLDLHYITYADVVVIGRISNYTIVPDPKARQVTGKLQAKPGAILTDYARFDIAVDEVLRGKTQSEMTVTWDNGTSSEYEKMPPGPFLIALRRTGSDLPFGLFPSAAGLPGPEILTVLQPLCAQAFIFPVDSEGDVSAQQILNSASRETPDR